ncbi:MAG: AAA family ATPase [Lachnospiraceae bacterium]|jgi:guanylate kinase|nr:AAA family ATPase [Lachnospiraceae bacterium]
MLVILSGVAGAGKDTVTKELLKTIPNAVTLPSYTDRAKREGDIEGETYNFVTTKQFEEMIKNNELYEYNVHHNHYYGTSRTLLKQKLDSGKIIIKDIDVNGTENLVKILKNDVKVITVFLKVSKEEIISRLKQREDKPSEQEIALRMSRFEYEESKMNIYDYIIENNDLEKTVNIIKSIISDELGGL